MRTHGAAAGHENDHLRIGRRQFLSWGAAVTASLAVAVVVPHTSTAAAAAATPTEVTIDLARLAPLYGSPSDLARAVRGQVWALASDGVMRRYDPERRTWPVDHNCRFPPGSTAHSARWGHPAGPTRMLMVISDES